MARKRQSKRLGTVGRGLSGPAEAVMRAFRLAKSSASPFMSTCGVFPEVSEQASDRLHAIVNDVAVKRLNKTRYLRDLQKRLRQLATSSKRTRQSHDELVERIGRDLTALLACEATAAYLFGLSVGMTVRALPERLE